MRLKTFLDEAGHELDRPVFALGGLVGEVEAWEALAEPWKAQLGDVPFFHATDFAASRRTFDGWDEAKKQALFDRLLPLVTDFLKQPASWGLGVALYTRDFNATIGKYVISKPDPFYLIEILRKMRDHLPPHLAPGEQVPVVLEAKGGVKGHMDDQYERCRDVDDPEKHLGVLSFGNKRRNVELQAADVIIYELFRGMKRLDIAEATGTSPGQLRPVAQALFDSKKCDFTFYSFEQLRQTAINELRGRIAELERLTRLPIAGSVTAGTGSKFSGR